MHSRAKAPTKAERKRMARVSELGCIACRTLPNIPFDTPAENHHLKDEGGNRRGHAFTLGLCGYHHAGRIPYGLTRKEVRETLGPALTDGTRPFAEKFGDDDSLLKFQEYLLSL